MLALGVLVGLLPAVQAKAQERPFPEKGQECDIFTQNGINIREAEELGIIPLNWGGASIVPVIACADNNRTYIRFREISLVPSLFGAASATGRRDTTLAAHQATPGALRHPEEPNRIFQIRYRFHNNTAVVECSCSVMVQNATARVLVKKVQG